MKNSLGHRPAGTWADKEDEFERLAKLERAAEVLPKQPKCGRKSRK
jgi:hypothetical protein